LLCVFYRAHDKELLCRASSKTHGNESLPCVLFYGARQRIFAVRFKYRRTTKIFFFLHYCNKHPLVFDVRRLETHDKDKGAQQIALFAVHFATMHDKDFFKNFDFCTSFYFSTIETLF
jgi:hypothetical protein